MKRKAGLLWVLLFAGLTLHAQYIIKGRVTDSLSGQPLEGAAVYIPAQQIGTVTDSAGNFRLSSRYDTLHLQVQMLGYKPYDRRLRLNRRETFLPIRLQEQVFNLSEVLISTPYARLQKDNVMKVNMRLMSDMQKRGVATLSEGMGNIPGVRMLNGTGAFAKPMIRGLTGNRIIMYQNEIRYDNYVFGAKHGMDITGEGYRSVEVIKGPASLLYGSDALGGIIYLVPEKFAPANRWRAGLYGRIASVNREIHSGWYMKQSGRRFRYIFRFTTAKAEDYAVPGGKFVLNSRFDNRDLKVAAGYFRGRHRLALRYNFHRARNGIYKGLSDTVSRQFQEPYQRTASHLLSLHDKIKIRNGQWDVKAGYSRIYRSLIRGAAPFIGMYSDQWSGDVKRHVYAGTTNWIAGTQLWQRRNVNFGRHYLLPDAWEASGGLFATMQRQCRNEWSVQAGLRGDLRYISTRSDKEHPVALNKYLHSFSGSAGVKKSWDDALYMRMNLAKGFRAPNLAELTSDGLHAGRIEKGNPHLHNEENIQADLDWEWKTDHVEITTDFYYNYFRNYIFQKPTGISQNGFPVYVYDQSRARLYGNETAVHIHPHPWDFVHLEMSYETTRGQKPGGEYLPLMPPDKWSAHLRLTVNRHKPETHPRFRLGIRYEFIDAYVRRAPGEPYFPSRSLWHAYLNATGKTPRADWTLYLNLHNLTGRYYVPALSAYREQGIPAPGRSVVLGFGIRFH